MDIRSIFILLLSLGIAGCQTTQPESASPAASKEIFAAEMSFDAQKGEVQYTLPEDALVRIRVGIKDGGPLLIHLLDWEPRKAGRHTERWNKKDASGKVDFGSRGDYMLILACISQDARPEGLTLSGIRGFRKAPGLEITFPDLDEKNEDGIPVLKDTTAVRVSLDAKDSWMIETKYEVGLYIDYVFLTEDEEGTNPFTYHLDTHKLNNGRHILTANIAGYNGEVGTKSILIQVKN